MSRPTRTLDCITGPREDIRRRRSPSVPGRVGVATSSGVGPVPRQSRGRSARFVRASLHASPQHARAAQVRDSLGTTRRTTEAATRDALRGPIGLRCPGRRHRAAVLFDYINGFHDTANAIATSVATRALRPQYALLMAAAFNFIGAFAGTAVAKTIGAGLVDEQTTTQVRGLRGADRRHRLEPHHLVAGPAQLQQPRADRRAAGRDAHRRRHRAPSSWTAIYNKVAVPAHHLAGPGLRHRAGPDGGPDLDLPERRAQAAGRPCSAVCRSSRPASWPLPTAPTTPRRRWASSRSPCSPRA